MDGFRPLYTPAALALLCRSKRSRSVSGRLPFTFSALTGIRRRPAAATALLLGLLDHDAMGMPVDVIHIEALGAAGLIFAAIKARKSSIVPHMHQQ